MQYCRRRFNIIRQQAGTEMDPLQELVSFAKQSGTANTSYALRELSNSDKHTLHRVLFENPKLLFSKYEGYDTVWRWLIKHDYFLIIKYILNKATGGEHGVRWYIPSNRYDENNGSTIFTDHSLYLSARLFDLLFTMSGEKLHLYNKMTKETALHILAKQNTIQGKETAFHILKNIVAENSTDLDPDLIDFAGRTALHYALERGELRMAELLVERVGADWDLGVKSAPSVSNETLASRHPECVEFLQKCREKYSIKPNSEGDGETCVICLDKIEASAYAMRCCQGKLHTVCLRKYLARAEDLRCFLCRRQEIREDKDLYDSIPNTVFKSKWEKERTAEGGGGATAASTPSTETELEATVASSDAATDDGNIRVVITPDQDFRLPPSNGGGCVPDTRRASVIMGVSSLMRDRNFSSDLSTASSSNNPSSEAEEDDHPMVEVNYRNQITRIFNREDSFPPPLPPSTEGDGWSDDDFQPPVLEIFSPTASFMPSPAPIFKTPAIFKGYYNFLGRKIRLLRVRIPPDCVEVFTRESACFEDILDSFSTARRELYNSLKPMTLTSYQSLPRNKVKIFLSSLRGLCSHLNLSYNINLLWFVIKCTKNICDVYGRGLTSNFGLRLKEYVKRRVEDEGERNVLNVQLKRVRYWQTICDGDDDEDLLLLQENMAEWLYFRDRHTENRIEIRMLHSAMSKSVVDSATNLDDFERLMAAIDHVLSIMFYCSWVE